MERSLGKVQRGGSLSGPSAYLRELCCDGGVLMERSLGKVQRGGPLSRPADLTQGVVL